MTDLTPNPETDADAGPLLPPTGAEGTVDPTHVAELSAPDHRGRNRLVINLMLAATFVVFLNETIIVVAVPRVMEDLRIEASTAQWLTTAFMLTMAVVIPTTGFLMQRLSTRSVFILAMSLFTVGTAIAAVAPGFEVLLVGRVIQASGTAVMMPLLMTTVMTLVPPQERGKTMGNISIIMSVAPAVGPAIGGVIVQALDWRWVFIIVLPIAIAALVIGGLRVQNVTETRKVPLDVLSVILSALAFGGLVYGLSSIGESIAGHTMVQPWMPITVGALALAAFLARQLLLQRRDAAFLDLRTFRSWGFSVSVILMVIMMGALFGTVFLLPLYLQKVLGLEPVLSGLVVVPGSLLMGIAGPFIGRLYDRVGPKPLVFPASFVVSGVMWFMTTFTENTPWVLVLVAHVLLSAGLAFMFTPLFTSSMASLSPRLYSHGSATIATMQQLAGAAGTALFIALYTIGSTTAADAGATEVSSLATGVHTAFLAGAIISVAAIVAAWFIPKPVEFDHAATAGGAH